MFAPFRLPILENGEVGPLTPLTKMPFDSPWSPLYLEKPRSVYAEDNLEFFVAPIRVMPNFIWN